MSDDNETGPVSADVSDEDAESEGRERRFAGREAWVSGAQTGRAAGALAANKILAAVAAVVTMFGALLLKLVPRSAKVWHAMAETGVERYWRASGGDAIGLIHKPNEEVAIEPVKWMPQDHSEEQSSGWKAKGREKTWAASADGREVDRLGKAPIVLLDESASQRATTVEARVAEAVDMGAHRPLVDAEEHNVQVDVTAEVSPDAGGDAAITDGGAQIRDLEHQVRQTALSDVLVDIAPEADHDGQHISIRKVKETYREKGDAEKMETAKQLGYLAGRSNKDMKSWMLKVMLIAGAIALGGLIGPEAFNALFGSGGGGGGGGSAIPLTLGAFGVGG